MQDSEANHLFILPHQDDEMGVLWEIEKRCKVSPESVFCIFVTDGGQKTKERDSESLAVLGHVGVLSKNIFFWGADHKIKNLSAIESVNKIYEKLLKFISQTSWDSIFVPSFEGGHADHDTINVATIEAAKNLGLQDKIYQFPLYNAYKTGLIYFRTLNIISERGMVIKNPIPFFSRLKYCYFIFLYPSQWKTWCGLGPFFIFDFVFRGKQKLQKVAQTGHYNKPHAGLLLYEKMGRCSWDAFKSDIGKFLNSIK